MAAVSQEAHAPSRTPAPHAAEALYERHSSRILGFCRYRLRNREEAEDAVQTTFLYAFNGLNRGVEPQAELPWLLKIAENVCHSRVRAARRRSRVETPVDLQESQDYTPAPHRVADELIGIKDALASIPESQRRAIVLREWKGLSYREIADELELSQAAVETLLFRARRSVAKALERGPARLAGSLGTFLQWLLRSTVAKVAVGAGIAAGVSLAVSPPLLGVPKHAPKHATPPAARAPRPAAARAQLQTRPAPAPTATRAKPRQAVDDRRSERTKAPFVRLSHSVATPADGPAAPLTPPSSAGATSVAPAAAAPVASEQPAAPKAHRQAAPTSPPEPTRTTKPSPLPLPPVSVPHPSVPPVSAPPVSLPPVPALDVPAVPVPSVPKAGPGPLPMPVPLPKLPKP